MEITFQALLSGLDSHCWKHWVYTDDPHKLAMGSRCLVVDTDVAELGADGFTPLIVEQKGFQELLSIQDIRDVRTYLGNIGFAGSPELMLFATQHYVDRDAYPAKAEVLTRTSTSI